MISVAHHPRFSEDMARVHPPSRMCCRAGTGAGRPPAIKEAGILMADAEHLALKSRIRARSCGSCPVPIR